VTVQVMFASMSIRIPSPVPKPLGTPVEVSKATDTTSRLSLAVDAIAVPSELSTTQFVLDATPSTIAESTNLPERSLPLTAGIRITFVAPSSSAKCQKKALSRVPISTTALVASSLDPIASAASSGSPMAFAAISEAPIASAASSEAPMASAAISEAPIALSAISEEVIASDASSEAPIASLAISAAPMASAAISEAPIAFAAISSAPMAFAAA